MELKIFLLSLQFGAILGYTDQLSNYSYVYDNVGKYLEDLNLNVASELNPDLGLSLPLGLAIYDGILALPTQLGLIQDYDFIIVGGGSAGSVIANRLTEISNWTVLLLEAGEPENTIATVPALVSILQVSPYNWKYFTEPGENVGAGLRDGRMHWPRGKALGGTSVINYMMYVRGNPLDNDRWAEQGNPGWSYEEVLPYYIKSEQTHLVDAEFEYHGTDGYLSTSESYTTTNLINSFLGAGEELGLPSIDYNAPNNSFGVSTAQAFLLNGRRDSNARAFLQPVLSRPNLHILTSAFVTKLLIDPETKEAYGVEYERLGITYQVSARKEVILSAGAINSAQLLLLSGIGPKEDLEELGIEVLENLSVGKNLQDHLLFPGLAFLVNETSYRITDVLLPSSITEFALAGNGPLTSLAPVEGLGFIKTNVSNETEPYPDIELLFLATSIAIDNGLLSKNLLNIRDEIYYPLFGPLYNQNQWTIYPILLHPKSSGYLKLSSTNPRDYPLLYPNYFSDPENHDVKTLIAAIRFIQNLSETEAFQRIGSTLNPNVHPGCEGFIFDSDEYWECALRSIAVSIYHSVGTVKMGPSNDSTAVVNHELKVYGIKNLRVADCGVAPFAISGHTNALATLIGEKVSDYIKEAWGAL